MANDGKQPRDYYEARIACTDSSKTRETVARLRVEGLSYSAISRRSGIAKSTVAYHARRLGVPADDRCARRYDWGEIQKAVDAGLSKSDCEERFGFCSATWSKAVKRGAIVPREWIIPIDELLVVGRKRSRGHLKNRLIREGLKENRCEECGITEWRGAAGHGAASRQRRRAGQPAREPPAALRELPRADGQLGWAGEEARSPAPGVLSRLFPLLLSPLP